MAKIEVPGLQPIKPAERPQEGQAEKAAGISIEGDLDPVLSQAVASQPLIPRPAKSEPETPPPDAEVAPSASGSPSFPAPRPRALGGLLVAGALALAGAVLTVALGGKHGRASQNGRAATGTEPTGFGANFLDPGELEIAKHFGYGPG